jgi:hypothetical protein
MNEYGLSEQGIIITSIQCYLTMVFILYRSTILTESEIAIFFVLYNYELKPG